MQSGPKCPICTTSATVGEFVTRTDVRCPRCGHFFLSSTAAKVLGDLSLPQQVTISAWIRENQDVEILQSMLPFLRAQKMPTVGEKAEKIIKYLSKKYPIPGLAFTLNQDFLKELEGVGYAQDSNELRFLFHHYLIEEKQFLFVYQEGALTQAFKISPKGWSFLDSLMREPNPRSGNAFIAMWFDDSMNDVWTAIDKAIKGAGYAPLRIDQKQHNNKIDDEIIAAIRRSKFLVSDFTGQRGGVYFESGVGLGLGLPVIWLCRHDELKDVHFDTRQYNFIVWEKSKLNELMSALRLRIEATIGLGPLSVAVP